MEDARQTRGEISMETWTAHSPDAEHLRALGHALGALRPAGTCVALLGDLGAGKTTLTQGLGEGLGVANDVTSPTFGLMVEHEAPCPLLHVDAYRLGPGEAAGIGLEESLETWSGVAVVEWADLVVEQLPERCVFVRLSHADEGRTVQAWASTPALHPLLARWHGALS